MKKFALALLGATMLTGAAQAADVYHEPESLKDGPVVHESGEIDWTGFYVGGQFGWVNSDRDLLIGPILDVDGLNSSGLIGGGRVGFDHARGRFLVGAFADYNFTDAEGTLDFAGASLSFEKDDEWTVGVRAGVIVAPRTLLYGLVGYTETSYSFNAPGLEEDFDYSGVTAGAGIEFAVSSNVFFGIEASHTWYGEENLLDTEGAEFEDELDETRILATLKVKLNGFHSSW